MLLIIAILILLITPAIMVMIQFISIRLHQSRIAYQYLIAFISTLSAWILVLLSRPDTFQIISLLHWQPEKLVTFSPELLLDNPSWSFSLGLSTLGLGVILTSATRLGAIKWHTLAGSILMTGFGLLTVLAGNPLTLLIAWAALDIFEASILILQSNDPSIPQKIVLVLSARAAGIVVLLFAMISCWSSGENLSFLSIQPKSTLLLLLAAVLRSGIFPLHLPFILESQLRRSLGTSLRMVNAASSFILLARIATIGLDGRVVVYLLGLVAIAALYGAASWVTAPDEMSGRPFWILGFISLSISASIRAQPEASIAWGIACLLSGGLVFLASPRDRYLLPLLSLGALNISGLPFTPLWEGWRTYGILPTQENLVVLIPSAVINIALISTHILLIIGYLRHISHQAELLEDPEQWVWILYLPGLIILIINQFIFGFYEIPESSLIPVSGWFSGIIVTLVSLLIWIRGQPFLSKFSFIPSYLSELESVLHLSWLYRFLVFVYRSIGRIITMISNILEGEGGLLWTIIIVLLIFSFFRK